MGMLTGIAAGIGVRYSGLSAESVLTVIRFVKPVGDLFLRMLFMMIMPLLLSALTLGIAEIGDIRKIGKVGLRTLVCTIAISTAAVLLGIALVTVFKPGENLSPENRRLLIGQYSGGIPSVVGAPPPSGAAGILDSIVNIVPKNPIEDMTRAFDPSYSGGGILAVIFFAVMLGIAFALTDPVKTLTFKKFLEGLYEIVMKIIGIGMKLAPYGVASLLFCATSSMGFSILAVLSKYVFVVLLGLALHLFVFYSIMLKTLGRMSPVHFFRNVWDVMLVAFSTSSSNATLPTTLKTAVEKLKLPRDISRFVLTVGSTANQNGTALYEGITVLFLAQCFGLHLPIAQQAFVVVLAVLAGIGTAGVPGGSLPAVVMVITGIGLPAESIGIIIGVDRLLDMSRTVLNVTGDMAVAVVVSRYEEKTGGISKEFPVIGDG
jgi:DAACS family dicarboxylate/amino acid:cation (Na+ or H+) symporter